VTPPAPRYQALALQVTTRSVGHLPDRESAREAIAANIRRIGTTIAASIEFLQQLHATPVRLVGLPEYALTGAPAGATFAAWRAKGALEMRGPEYEQLGTIAQAHGIFLAGNAYEADPAFPDLYFQSSFVVGPPGDVILRYRRLVSLYSPSPYDVLERYLQVHGPDSLFPVVATEIGRLAAIASEEILYAEIARCLAMRGAEVFVHSTSEMGSPRPTAKEIARRARAAENLAYVVSANAGSVIGTGLPTESTTGMAKIVDFEGGVIAEAMPGGDSLAAHATLDLDTLRARRREPGLSNLLVRQPLQAYAESYRRAPFHQPGQLAVPGIPLQMDPLRRAQGEDIERLARLGLI